ncbi:MAG: sortase [Clostridia bacterium]|nr:sortase [Clostridia bacterium]
MIRRGAGICIVILGVFLIVAAVGLTVWNIKTDIDAGEVNEEIVDRVYTVIRQSKIDREKENETESDEPGSVTASDFLPGIYTPDFTPGGVNDEEPEIITVVVDGREYIGILSIPVLGLELSVMRVCDDSTIDVAPGRWRGSPYRPGFVIGGHNYRSHLGKIDRLKEGDLVLYTDLAGRTFTYSVVGQEILDGNDGKALRDKEWGLSLFTCTLTGNRRIVVRCLADESSS